MNTERAAAAAERERERERERQGNNEGRTCRAHDVPHVGSPQQTRFSGPSLPPIPFRPALAKHSIIAIDYGFDVV